jgi:two-component system, OmpR family, sensor histidine kinase ArlS
MGAPFSGTPIFFIFRLHLTTGKLKELISGLNRHFLLAGLLSLIFMFIIIILLTRFVTHPLIEMSATTKRISKGDFTVSFPKLGKDELGDLGESIKILARDLQLLKNERNEFLASISHELRTPLTYIKGYSDIAQKPETTEVDRNQYLAIIHEEAVKLSTLVKELFQLHHLLISLPPPVILIDKNRNPFYNGFLHKYI